MQYTNQENKLKQKKKKLLEYFKEKGEIIF